MRRRVRELCPRPSFSPRAEQLVAERGDDQALRCCAIFA